MLVGRNMNIGVGYVYGIIQEINFNILLFRVQNCTLYQLLVIIICWFDIGPCYVCMYVLWINRVSLPILLVVS